MLLKLQWLTDIFDWLHHNWERAHVQRKVALVIFWVYVAALCCVELKRQGMLPPALAQLTPHSHFSAIQLAFTLILGLEVMSLIFIISTSFSRSVGKQFEILALILLRNAFKELAHLPEPVSIAGNLDPVIHIAVTALGALGIFVALGIYGKLASSYAYIQSPEMRMRFVISKKLLSLTLFVIFLGIGIRDAWIHIHTGEDMRFFETIYTVLIFADIALVLISQRYMPSFRLRHRHADDAPGPFGHPAVGHGRQPVRGRLCAGPDLGHPVFPARGPAGPPAARLFPRDGASAPVLRQGAGSCRAPGGRALRQAASGCLAAAPQDPRGRPARGAGSLRVRRRGRPGPAHDAPSSGREEKDRPLTFGRDATGPRAVFPAFPVPFGHDTEQGHPEGWPCSVRGLRPVMMCP